MRRKTAGGVKALPLRKTRAATVPSQIGKCKACGEDGRVRYFVAS